VDGIEASIHIVLHLLFILAAKAGSIPLARDRVLFVLYELVLFVAPSCILQGMSDCLYYFPETKTIFAL